MQRPRGVHGSPLGPRNQGQAKSRKPNLQCMEKISATCDPGSPDQVEGQPVYDEGLEGSSSQSQVELETLLRGWAPHTVRAQGCSPQRTHLEERSAKAGPGGDLQSRASPGEERGGTTLHSQ